MVFSNRIFNPILQAEFGNSKMFRDLFELQRIFPEKYFQGRHSFFRYKTNRL
ncbi:hypothetical protein LEP1GSC066_0743 [Leptospira sp. serovar Kenya str. Sh9]|uniref:Uncharacterized protein n=1 Tax=Leptospira borgpetersenii str. Brem 328 TaxID=1049780 RepID=A0ABC9SJK9_LEPBO|nr:hypothetical protein LEP1GSC066_0743 [Leptospira sp. serovar Kenya str. Sh9]EMN15249.1 hypothetical protein LEP1GSC055_3681 [Leptospira borgpetersenii str. Brem 307]EMN18008.1 hypothetical protein LEP1GSC056_0289 [Leptospira borgpetersenii str. Brem 328]